MTTFFNCPKHWLLALLLLASTVKSNAQLSQTDINNLTDIINGVDELLKEDEPSAAAVAASNTAYANAAAAAAETARRNKERAEQQYTKDYLNKYLSTAEEGNDFSQMMCLYGLLYVQKTNSNCDIRYMLPADWKSWMKEGIKTKRFNAINFIGLQAIYPNPSYNLDLTIGQGLQILESAADSEVPLPAYLGTGLATITAEFAAKKNIDTAIKGVYISSIIPRHAAEEAGLAVGDIILKAGDQPFYTHIELMKTISNLKAGERLKLTVNRNGREMTFTPVLKSRPGVPSRVDTRVVLADYYNGRQIIAGGEDDAKALMWYTKAAQDGSPKAMYNLGKIYLYGLTGDKTYFVRHKAAHDEEAAFNWFSKSIADPHYATSLFQRQTRYGSCFMDESYQELITMYKKGIGCEKSEAKAAELTKVYNDLLLERKLED